MTLADIRVGQGWDSHRLVYGRDLMLGGVKIDFDKGEEAHSDGDVLIHAIIDALLGAAGLGDIGFHFPPSDMQWKNADSRRLLQAVRELLRQSGWGIINIDCTVILEKPRLSGYRETIRESLAACLGIEKERLSFKAKSAEALGEIGRGEALEALAVCLIGREA